MIATKTPAVGYIRMSSDKQEASPQQQRDEIEKLADAKGYHLVRWYDDHGISGDATEKRIGFKRMIADASEIGDFEAILCWDQDRFGRFDSLEAGKWCCPLRDAGVSLVTAAQGVVDWTDFQGRMIYNMVQEGKHEYLRDLSRNILRGRLKKAKEGKWTGARPQYGYAVTSEGDLVLGPDEQVEIVLAIFDRYGNADTSLRGIAEELNARGLRSPKGSLWEAGSIATILRRKTYATGKAVQLRESKGKYNTIRGSDIVPAGPEKGVKPVDEWFTVDCPKIIDMELWDRTQARLVRRRGRTRSKRGQRALLTDLLYCSHCGGRMTSDTDAHGSVVYVCATYNNYGTVKGIGCHRNLIHESVLLDFLVATIRDTALSPANAERLRSRVRQKVTARRDEDPATVRRLTQRLANLDREVREAAAELRRTPDDLYDLAVDEVRQVRSKRDRVAADLAAIERRSGGSDEGVDPVVEKALARLADLRDRLTSADPTIAREALARIVDRVELTFEHVHTKCLTRSHFRRGLLRFKRADLYGHHIRRRSRRSEIALRVGRRDRSRSTLRDVPHGPATKRPSTRAPVA